MHNVLQAPLARQTQDGAALQFSVTGYSGFEDEILRLHNDNRPVAKSRRWLDWRYAQPAGVPAPKVFWIRHRDQSAVGMASLIFRRYWVNDEPREIAVLGDISVQRDLRGVGLGRQLMKFIGWHLSSWQQYPACVIPNEAAERCLSSTGWTTGGSLVPHVCVTDPADALVRLVRNQFLARSIAVVFKRLMATGLHLYAAGSSSSLELVDDVDETFDTFWRSFPKSHAILRDMSQETLRWRYIRHPDYHFRVAKLTTREGLAGYLIFRVDLQHRICRIYDVLVKRPRDLRRMLMLFVRHSLTVGGTTSIRLVLADQHPYRRLLWQSGFFTRPGQAVFQVRSAKGCFDECTWQITSGDKDV